MILDRSVTPEFVTPKSFKLQPVESIILNGGVKLHLLNNNILPIVKIEFIFQTGIWNESKNGHSFFTAKMMSEGTQKYNAEQIFSFLDQYGVFLDINPGFDYIELSIHSTQSNVEYILPLIIEILNEPTFPEEELDHLKNIQSQQLKVNNQKNSFIASRMFRNLIFGESYPYGNIMDEEAISKIERLELVNHHNKLLKNSFEVFISGDITPKIRSLVINSFDNSHFKYPIQPDISFTPRYGISKNVDKEESLQSSIRIGRDIINKNHPEYITLLVLNEVFGGFFGSRLMQNIREDKGYTYGIYSHLATFKNAAYFVISTDVKKEFKDRTIEEINKEILRIKEQEIEDTELQDVKNYLKGSILNSFTSTFAQMEKYKNVYLHNLDKEFYDTLFDKIDNVNSTMIQNFANEQLFDKNLNLVTIG